LLKRFVRWFFAIPPDGQSPWQVVVWWEKRRIPFNIVIGSYAVVCLAGFLWAIITSGTLKPGEDAIEPLALLVAPLGINILYTLGWLVELPSRRFLSHLTPQFGPILLAAGTGLGLFLITIPAVLWVGYRVLQLLGTLVSHGTASQ